MSRSGYTDDWSKQWSMIRYRGAVASAIRGARGQAFLREMAAALDAMPVKRLMPDSFEEHDGVCALGCVAKARGMDMSKLDPEYMPQVAHQFGIAPALAKEIVYENDDEYELYTHNETPEKRFTRVRAWVSEQIKPPTSNPSTETE